MWLGVGVAGKGVNVGVFVIGVGVLLGVGVWLDVGVSLGVGV